MSFQRRDTSTSGGELGSCVKSAAGLSKVALLFKRLSHVQISPDKLRIQVGCPPVILDGFIIAAREVRCDARPNQCNGEIGSISRARVIAIWAASCCPLAISKFAYQW